MGRVFVKLEGDLTRARILTDEADISSSGGKTRLRLGSTYVDRTLGAHREPGANGEISVPVRRVVKVKGQ